MSRYSNDEDGVAKELAALRKLPRGRDAVLLFGREIRVDAFKVLADATAAVAGAVVSSVDTTVAAPLKRLKVVLMTQRSYAYATTKYDGEVAAFVGLLEAEGLAAFWKGNLHNVLRCCLTQVFKSCGTSAARIATQLARGRKRIDARDDARDVAAPPREAPPEWLRTLKIDLSSAAVAILLAPLEVNHVCRAACPHVPMGCVGVWRKFGASGLSTGLGLKVASQCLGLPIRAVVWRASRAGFSALGHTTSRRFPRRASRTGFSFHALCLRYVF